MNLESSIIELRQYKLHQGQRDVLIELFEREFIIGQEKAGMHIIGQFQDLDKPNDFTWIRAFPNMVARQESLEYFYNGAVWQAHREAANATMIDSDNVLLLKPVQGFSGQEKLADNEKMLVFIIPVTPLRASELIESCQKILEPQVQILAMYITETSANTFPQLPIRDDFVFVALHE